MSHSQDEVLLFEKRKSAAWITFNRPEKLNAFNQATLDRLVELAHHVNADPEVKAVVFTGAGRAFSSGRDAGELGKVSEMESARGVPEPAGHETTAVLHIEVPTIAAINGPCVGGALGIALMCDMRIASEKAVLIDGHVPLGMCPSTSSWLLPRLVGSARALRIFLTNQRISGQQAYDLGIVEQVVPHEELMPAVDALVEKIAVMPPFAVKMTKQVVRAGLEHPFLESMQFVGYVRALQSAAGERTTKG